VLFLTRAPLSLASPQVGRLSEDLESRLAGKADAVEVDRASARRVDELFRRVGEEVADLRAAVKDSASRSDFALLLKSKVI
jgi:hypothetical protein